MLLPQHDVRITQPADSVRAVSHKWKSEWTDITHYRKRVANSLRGLRGGAQNPVWIKQLQVSFRVWTRAEANRSLEAHAAISPIDNAKFVLNPTFAGERAE